LIQETRPQIELYLLKTVKILKKFNNCVLNAARNITSKGETTTNSIVVFYLVSYCYFLLFCLWGFLQAYTMELEAEVAKLKEDNEELRKKQVLSLLQDTVG
jgi:hypothetical protein